VKKIAIIPTLLTLGNGVCGFASVAFASKIDSTPESQIYFAVSAWFIVAAMLFDALDGYAARLSKSASEFGGQLDSLCDAISFGLAPAFLLLRLGREWESPLVRQSIAVIAALYMVCAILRLARFNVENSPDPASHKRFKGLPSPAAAGCVISFAILRGELANNWAHLDDDFIRALVRVTAPVGTLFVALLMVSRIPFPHLTKRILRGRRQFSYVVQIIVAVFTLALVRELALIVIFWAYALSMPIWYLLNRRLRARSLSTASLEEQRPRSNSP
jgi:CDP-diacylglycerol--serine O-phosphatidyltransferase